MGKFASKSIVKIVESRNLPLQVLDKRYITLSHCWGASAGIKLTTARYSDFLHGLDLNALPRTFRDAITLTRYLGIDYIWIDCMCIIQDSVPDWETESRLMDEIYHGSFLNIGANAYSTSHGGLFQDRDPASVAPLQINLPWPPGHRQRQDVVFFPQPHSSSSTHVERGPLSTRGWVVQERLLAPRTLHFVRHKAVWECPTMTASETDTAGIIDGCWHQIPRIWAFSRPLDPSESPSDSCLSQWLEAIRIYTKGELTFQSDKLVAVLGLARRLQATWNDDSIRYLAGLWSYRLESQLLWRVWRFKNGDGKPADDRAPSWSWASLRGSLLLPYLETERGSEQLLSHVIHTETEPVHHPLGPVQRGLLRIRGPICPVTAVQDGDGKNNALKLSNTRIKFRELSPDGAGFATPSGTESGQLFLLGIRQHGLGEVHMDGLVLQLTGLARGQYVRVGYWNAAYQYLDAETERRLEEILGGGGDKSYHEQKLMFGLIEEAFASMTLPQAAFEEEDFESKVYAITVV